ncbi:MAG: hypothetical protein PHI32_06670 [Dysgonamonadaceae bacterium]|nr:hypothetical protein [Dysgonamonadaceae bacterium]
MKKALPIFVLEAWLATGIIGYALNRGMGDGPIFSWFCIIVFAILILYYCLYFYSARTTAFHVEPNLKRSTIFWGVSMLLACLSVFVIDVTGNYVPSLKNIQSIYSGIHYLHIGNNPSEPLDPIYAVLHSDDLDEIAFNNTGKHLSETELAELKTNLIKANSNLIIDNSKYEQVLQLIKADQSNFFTQKYYFSGSMWGINFGNYDLHEFTIVLKNSKRINISYLTYKHNNSKYSNLYNLEDAQYHAEIVKKSVQSSTPSFSGMSISYTRQGEMFGEDGQWWNDSVPENKIEGLIDMMALDDIKQLPSNGNASKTSFIIQKIYSYELPEQYKIFGFNENLYFEYFEINNTDLNTWNYVKVFLEIE